MKTAALLLLAMTAAAFADGLIYTVPSSAGPIYQAGNITVQVVPVPKLFGVPSAPQNGEAVNVCASTTSPEVTGFDITVYWGSAEEMKIKTESPALTVYQNRPPTGCALFRVDSLVSIKRILVKERKNTAALEIQYHQAPIVP